MDLKFSMMLNFDKIEVDFFSDDEVLLVVGKFASF